MTEIYTTSVRIPPTKIRLGLQIDNIYDDGKVRTTTEVTVNTPPLKGDGVDGNVQTIDKDTSAYDVWLDAIFEVTGTGDGFSDGAYFVKVTESSCTWLIPVGTEYEFGL